MSDYTQSIDFSAKDALASGNASKVAKGADIDTELDLISTAIATKYDSNDLASQAQAEAETLNTVLITPLRLANWADANGGMVGDIQALTDPAADTILGWDDSAGAAINFTIGTGLTTATTTIELDFLGLEDLVDPNADRVMFWDDSAGKLDWLTIGNGLDLTTTTLSLASAAAGAGLTESSGVLAVGAGNGITVNANDVDVTDQSATTSNPIDVTSGVYSIDVAGLTTIEGNALAAADTFLVDDGGTPKGIEYQDMGFIVQTAQATQTLAAADMNTIMEFNGTATLTLPLNSTTALPIGSAVIIVVDHATQVVTVTADTSVTLNSIYHPGGGSAASDTVRAGGTAVLLKIAADEWYLSGDITT